MQIVSRKFVSAWRHAIVARNDEDNDNDDDDFDPNDDLIEEDNQIPGVDDENDENEIGNKANMDNDNRDDDETVENAETMVDQMEGQQHSKNCVLFGVYVIVFTYDLSTGWISLIHPARENTHDSSCRTSVSRNFVSTWRHAIVARNDDNNDDDFDLNADPIEEDGQIPPGVDDENDENEIGNKANIDDDNRDDDEMVENAETMVDQIGGQQRSKNGILFGVYVMFCATIAWRHQLTKKLLDTDSDLTSLTLKKRWRRLTI